MSVLRTLNTGASGLRSHSEAIGVTGDNIANVNTVGFKGSRAVFQDILGRSIAGGNAPPQAGAGSRLAHVQQMWSQGALVTTEVQTDLSITGNGFFVVEGNSGGMNGRFYTRAGQFHLDDSGTLVNADNLHLQGYQADETGQISGTLGDLIVGGGGTIPATVTTSAALSANLDSNAVVPAAWDATDPTGTSNFSTSVTVYDSLGAGHELTVYFRNQGANAWEWHAMVDGGELVGGTAGTPTEGADGTLTFTSNGELDTETVNASSWSFVNATGAQAIAFDFGTSITTDTGTGLDGTTQFASPSTVNEISQDGFAAGSVSAFTIADDGVITGVFSNGQRRTLGQVAVSNFASVDGLARAGNNLWLETGESGQALIGAAESGGRGAVTSGALEQSNVDLGREFVNLISYQRGFQANTRVITTADEMYSDLVALKR